MLTPYTKVNSRWIIELNVKSKTLKLVKENDREYLYNLGVEKDFLNHNEKANKK